MKKNVLALSIAAMIGGLGFAGAASAQLAVNESGTGHMLLVPYYTAQDGNMSVFHVVNTDTTNGKALKVRFRGASNSDDVLDFQVFMSPGDVWTAAVVKGANDVASLVTADGTCTLPAIAKNTPVSFVQDRLPAADKANNTREGYVEIFNMADIDSSKQAVYGGVGNTIPVNAPLYTAIKHVNGVAPCSDSVLQGTLASGAGTPGLLPPTAGLMGSWYIINVPQSTTFSGAANAILATGATRNVFYPQMAGNAPIGKSADPLFKSAILAPQFYDLPDLSTPYLVATTDDQAGADAQAAALTAALAQTSVINQFSTDASITAKTDWVFSMPTRRYNVAANYAVASTNAAYRVYNAAVGSYFTAGNTTVNAAGQICLSSINQTFFDREETFATSGAVFSPGNVTRLPLCGEVSVLSFASGSVLGADVAKSSAGATYANGWGRVNFAAPGVPVLGASFQKVSNPNAQAGISGNYGITWPHAYK